MTLREFRDDFLKGTEKMASIQEYPEIPEELRGEDVYNTFYVFRNEEIAVDYVCEHYKVDRNALLEELHEEDSLRKEYGKEDFLRSAEICHKNAYILSEMLDGTYILWEAY